MMNLRTPYQVLVDSKKAAMLSVFDREMRKRRDAEAFERFMRLILTPLG